MKMAVTVGLPW